MLKANLILRRDSDDDIKMRNLEVHLDGAWVADVGYGRSFETELEAGEHEIMVTNRMKRVSATVSLKPGETAVFQGTNVLSKGLSAIIGAFGVVAYHPTLKRVQ